MNAARTRAAVVTAVAMAETKMDTATRLSRCVVNLKPASPGSPKRVWVCARCCWAEMETQTWKEVRKRQCGGRGIRRSVVMAAVWSVIPAVGCHLVFLLRHDYNGSDDDNSKRCEGSHESGCMHLGKVKKKPVQKVGKRERKKERKK